MTSIKDAHQQTMSAEAKKYSAAATEHGERSSGFKNTVAVMAASNDNSSTNQNAAKKTDDRKGNRGSLVRAHSTNSFKAKTIDLHETEG